VLAERFAAERNVGTTVAVARVEVSHFFGVWNVGARSIFVARWNAEASIERWAECFEWMAESRFSVGTSADETIAFSAFEFELADGWCRTIAVAIERIADLDSRYSAASFAFAVVGSVWGELGGFC